MSSVKRIEIIAASQEVEKIIHALDTVKAPGYSLISNVVGKGHLRTVSDDLNLGSSQLSNAFILCFCPETQTITIVEAIKPILNKYGGVCYVSDAQEMI